MLIHVPQEFKPKYRLYQSSYTSEEINKIFDGKELCLGCPYMLLWKGKAPEGTKEIHRAYCKFSHYALRELPAILGLSIEETQRQVLLLRNNNPTAPDVIKVHPQNKNRFVVSSLLTKELNECALDKDKQGIEKLPDGTWERIYLWRAQHLKPIS